MAGASTSFPYTPDGFSDGAYDPSIADALNVQEGMAGHKPPQGGTVAAGGTTLTNIITQSLPDTALTTTQLLTTGVGYATLVGFVKGQKITNLNLNSGAAVGTQTHFWAAITTCSGTVSGVVQAVTADGGTVGATTNGVQTMALTSPWTVPTTGNYYVFVTVAASGTNPTFDAGTATAGLRGTQFPILAGTAGSGLTTPPAVGATLSTALTVGKPIGIYFN